MTIIRIYLNQNFLFLFKARNSDECNISTYDLYILGNLDLNPTYDSWSGFGYFSLIRFTTHDGRHVLNFLVGLFLPNIQK